MLCMFLLLFEALAIALQRKTSVGDILADSDSDDTGAKAWAVALSGFMHHHAVGGGLVSSVLCCCLDFLSW